MTFSGQRLKIYSTYVYQWICVQWHEVFIFRYMQAEPGFRFSATHFRELFIF